MFNELRKIFIKRKLKHELGHPYLLLSDKDLEKLNKGYGVTFYIEEYVPEIIVKSEKSYNEMISECNWHRVTVIRRI